MEHRARQLDHLVAAYHDAGLQLHIHVNGDEASEVAIDALERALVRHARRDHRHTLQHCQMADAAQFTRMRALGLCVNLFCNHLYYWGDIHRDVTLGPDRAERMDAAGTASALGIPFAMHSDAPITPIAPLFTAWCAVNRRTAAGRVLGASERISVADALRAITLGAAYTLRLDDEIGSIEIGKRADFAVLADDPSRVPPEALKDVRVVGTMVGGVPFEAPNAAGATSGCSAGIGFDSRAQRRAIPLTVVGGFLGSGKTTLLNAVLAQAEGRRIAILVNDFGMLSIDAALIFASSATTISLSNGCVCCTLIGGLAQALIDILQLDPAPDHIVVEASGVGDPGRIAQIARADRSFAQDATIVVAAADQIEMLAADRYVGDTVQKQLASADLIVLNKRDLVSDLQAEAILSWLRSVSPGARIVGAVDGKLPCDVVLGPAQRSAATYARAAAASYQMVAAEATDHGHRFSTRTFRCAQPLSEAAMRCALGALPHAVLRAKGFVRFDAAPEIPQLIQVVGRRWSISAAPAVTRAEASVLVIIGAAEALAAADLTALEKACSGSAMSR